MIIAAALAWVLALPSGADAQEWPSRPVTMVVAYAAGGPVDSIARIFAARLSEVLGQQVLVENIGGAGGMVGASRVAKAAPDGYTFLFGGLANLAQNQTLYKAPMYNAATDFTPVGLITDSPRVLITRKDFPVKTLPDFIAYAKADPNKLSYGSAGGGSGSHVCALLLDGFIGAKITHVPYRGAGPAMQDLIAGRLDYMAEQISTAFPQIESGNVKAIAMMGPDRASVLPNLPSAKEGGLTNFDCGAWAALVLPLRTAEAIVRKLNKAASETIDSAVVRERLAAVGVTIVPAERRSPEFLAKYIPSEIEKWAGPIKASGVSGE
jgi:tripartite-type tricarboxylate transporter receptor subunit TctC